MILVDSLLGALSRFPYLTIPFIIGVVLLCNWIAVKWNIPADTKWIFVIIGSTLLAILCIVPAWLVYRSYDEQTQAIIEKDLLSRYPVSAMDAVNGVAALPQVHELITLTQQEGNTKHGSMLLWEQIPHTIPATKKGYPLVSVSTSSGPDGVAYNVYVRQPDGSIDMYSVDAKTGVILAQ